MNANVETLGCGTTCRKQLLRAQLERIGWGSLLSVGLLLAVCAYSPLLAWHTLTEALYSLVTLSPYLAASFALAGYTKAASIDLLVTRAFRGKVMLMIVFATLLGVLTPLCSCSVVALVAVLLRARVPLAPVMAFWMASPVISPDLYIYTWGVLGPEIANARFLAAVFMALSAGFITWGFERAGAFRAPMRKGFAASTTVLGAAIDPVWKFWREPARRRAFVSETALAARFILPWMVLAFLLESLIASQVPAQVVANWIGMGSRYAILNAVLVSTPTYINGISAVPVVKGLLVLGMSKPAALAYLAAGSITTVPAIMAVLPLVRLRVFFWHLVLGLGGAVIASYAYQSYLGS
jgi:uncharacterized membrane protein YraQ (UPF0718 family)